MVKVGSAGAPLLRGVDCAAQLDAPRPHLLLSRLGRAQRVVRLRSLRRLELGEGLRRVRLGLGARGFADGPAYPPHCGVGVGGERRGRGGGEEGREREAARLRVLMRWE